MLVQQNKTKKGLILNQDLTDLSVSVQHQHFFFPKKEIPFDIFLFFQLFPHIYHNNTDYNKNAFVFLVIKPK